MVRSGVALEPRRVRPGDAVLLSGDIGRHGIAVMAAREGFGFEGDIASDCAPLAATVMRLIDAGIELHCLRDPTRGGLATTLVEIAQTGGVVIRINEASVAISDPVRGACELLGLDPLYVANEGRFVAFVPQHAASTALAVMRDGPGGADAAIIGRVEAAGAGRAARRHDRWHARIGHAERGTTAAHLLRPAPRRQRTMPVAGCAANQASEGNQ